LGKFDIGFLKISNIKGKLGYNQLYKEPAIKDKPEYDKSIKDLVDKSLLSKELVGKQRVNPGII